jgi:hypothetical protein
MDVAQRPLADDRARIAQRARVTAQLQVLRVREADLAG